MSVVPLFDGHKGSHCARRRPSLRRRLAVAIANLWDALRTFEFAMPPAPWFPLPDRPGVIRLRAELAEGEQDEPSEIITVDGVLTEEDAEQFRDGWAQTTALAGEHPYPPLPVTLPLASGDGHVHIDENGHVTVRRGEPALHPTLHDLRTVPRYLDAMSGGKL